MVKLTKALMMHANDLFDLTNSQVMILVETPSGERVWSANGRLRNEFDKEGRISNRAWGMKEVIVESSINSTNLLDEKRPETPPVVQPPPSASPAKSASALVPTPSASSSSTPFPRNAHEFLQQQQRQLALPPSNPSRSQQMDHKRDVDGQPEDAESFVAKRARLSQNGSIAFTQAGNLNSVASNQPMSAGPASTSSQQSMSAGQPFASSQQSMSSGPSFNSNQQTISAGTQFSSSQQAMSSSQQSMSTGPQFPLAFAPTRPLAMPGIITPQLHSALPNVQIQSSTLSQILTVAGGHPGSSRSYPYGQQPMQQQRSGVAPSLYDPSQPTEEPAPMMFPSPDAEKNYVASELDKLHQAGKIRFSWLEIERAFVVIRRDSAGHGDIVKRVAGHGDFIALKSDLQP